MLGQSSFDLGIAAPIPTAVTVANKFGTAQKDDVVDLHDCGIIYYPRHPYIMCIMTRGESLAQQEALIAEISRILYTEVDRRFEGS